MARPVISDTLTASRADFATADVLDKAAKVIEANGFHKPFLWDTKQAAAGTPLENCRVDIIGAIAIVLCGNPRYSISPRVRSAEQALTGRCNAPSVAAWCTYPGNGKAAAVALLRSTADALWAEA